MPACPKRRFTRRVLLCVLLPIVGLLGYWIRCSVQQRERVNDPRSSVHDIGYSNDRNQKENDIAAPASQLPSQELVVQEPDPATREPVVVPDWHREMVLIPPVEFTHPAFGMEAPFKSYSEAFCIDRYEVSSLRYQAFLNATGYPPPERGHWPEGRFPDGAENLPVFGVSWEEAAAFAKWEGKRLPTVLEWELAAGRGDDRKYPWGNEDGELNKFANVFHQFVRGKARHEYLTPIDSYPNGVSPYGVFNMVGNVIEWTATEVGNRGHFLKGSIRNRESAGPGDDYSHGYVGFRGAMSVEVREAEGGTLRAEGDGPISRPTYLRACHTDSNPTPIQR